MDIRNKIVAVTGVGDGIGAALARGFVSEGARSVAIIDLNREKAEAVAKEVGGRAYAVDVTNEASLRAAIDSVAADVGPIDIFCSNAGIVLPDPDFDNATSAPDSFWEKNWQVHVMSHVYAARALLPSMIEQGSGYLVNTSSAAGLLSQIGSATYSASKHAAVGFAEALAITHRKDGIKVSVLCPQAVDTPMFRGTTTPGAAHVDGVISAADVAAATMQGIKDERFLILPDPQVLSYIRNKAENYDKWIGGMSKLRLRIQEPSHSPMLPRT
jgi:NAD(P)-dependent dehydrogenase (short-subunit alcohol dehydrogenase family)